MITRFALTTVAAFWAASAFAQICPGKDLVLDCTIGTKALTVCIGGGEASYAYGPRGAPELALTQPLGEMQGVAWSGVGRSIWEEILFFNGPTSYAVWHSVDRLDENHPLSGGVLVSRNDTVLADLTCEAGSVEANIFAISDGFAEAGYCWDRAESRFARVCSE